MVHASGERNASPESPTPFGVHPADVRLSFKPAPSAEGDLTHHVRCNDMSGIHDRSAPNSQEPVHGLHSVQEIAHRGPLRISLFGKWCASLFWRCLSAMLLTSAISAAITVYLTSVIDDRRVDNELRSPALEQQLR